MDTIKTILLKKEYDGITFRFKEVMDAKGINRNQLAKHANIRFEVADRFYNGKIERLDIDILARVCYALSCNVGDVIVYKRNTHLKT